MNAPYALIVDDNDHNLEVLIRMIRSVDGDSIVLHDPSGLDDILPELDAVDVIFLDLELPIMDGYELLHKLKNELDVSVPIVAYTVHTSEFDVARAQGFDSFLGKPIDLDLFPGQLERILNGEAVWYIP